MCIYKDIITRTLYSYIYTCFYLNQRNYNLPLKYLYVGEMGIIQRRKSSGYWLTVEATANVSDHAHQRVCHGFLHLFYCGILLSPTYKILLCQHD